MPKLHTHEPRRVDPDLWYAISPAKHILIGFAIITGMIIGTGLAVIVTAWFWLSIGFFATAFMYAAIGLMLMAFLIRRVVKRANHGFGTLAHYDPDYADWHGSTARGGTPHDPYGIIPGMRPRRYPPDDHDSY